MCEFGERTKKEKGDSFGKASYSIFWRKEYGTTSWLFLFPMKYDYLYKILSVYYITYRITSNKLNATIDT